MRFRHQGLTGSDLFGAQGAVRSETLLTRTVLNIPIALSAKRAGVIPGLPRFGSRLGRAFYRGVSVRES